ncbi:DUF1990 family protein [Streptomyces ficellus]|uniref:DUF1990 domain-containing protein n=1 Tax=Streptomyces ficellus TaxID=1977088 RepID=A0A6I6FFZ5_9ACTN|nr:DUF1990 domain-containing protein [Streptomyces ficellus]QGV77419.1 DUF1990 domain-containing protein [Streptomyces ficellus]
MTRLIRSLSTPAATSGFSYPDVGATRTRPLPAGYHHLHHEALIGHGPHALASAGAAVTTWAMHRSSGVRVRAGSARAEPGTRVDIALGAGPLRIGVPCEVVWTAYEEDRIGFAYGTLHGHPEIGEESFVVDRRPDGSVWFTVTAFSRPGRWYTRAAGPVVPVLQRAYARHLGRTLRKIAAA